MDIGIVNEETIANAKKIASETMIYMIDFELMSLDLDVVSDQSTKEKVLIKTLFDGEKLVEYNQKEALVKANKLIMKETASKLIELIKNNKEILKNADSIVDSLKLQLIKSDINDDKLKIREVIDNTLDEFENNLYIYNIEDNIELRAVAYFLMIKLANEVLLDLKKTT